MIIWLKVDLKKDQAASIVGKVLILSQLTAAMSWRKASWSKFFRERLETITGGRLTEEPERVQAIAQ